STTSAATVAPGTGLPRTGSSPPTISTSVSSMIDPGSPSSRATFSLSSGATRYCLPPVLMTANIFASRSIPVLGGVRTGFLTVGCGVVLAARQPKQRGGPKRPALRGGYGDPPQQCQGTETPRFWLRNRRRCLADGRTNAGFRRYCG